nr:MULTISPECIES: potassium channel family protein [unclassified Bradyrhizobium]QIG99613.1 two pore domain potassium channel family protein [Bradyrhizobium sp. 6(2017)]
MLFQLIVGSAVSAINIVLHSLFTVLVIGLMRNVALSAAGRFGLQLSGVMVTTALILMVAHTLEIMVWSLAYFAMGAAPTGSDLIYFAFVNYTTLGYGDVIPVKQWLLVGPMAAMNGILMFGWSTAVLFEVLQRTIERQGALTKSS